MRPAPAVSVQGAGGRPWALARGLLAGLALASALGWWAGWLGLAAAWLMGVVLAPAAAVAGWVAWRAAPPVLHLSWDGQTWALQGRPGELDVMIDLDRWLLLRWRPFGSARLPWRARWLALAAHEAPAHWHGLRVALFASPPTAAPAPARLARGAVE